MGREDAPPGPVARCLDGRYRYVSECTPRGEHRPAPAGGAGGRAWENIPPDRPAYGRAASLATDASGSSLRKPPAAPPNHPTLRRP